MGTAKKPDSLSVGGKAKVCSTPKSVSGESREKRQGMCERMPVSRVTGDLEGRETKLGRSLEASIAVLISTCACELWSHRLFPENIPGQVYFISDPPPPHVSSS